MCKILWVVKCTASPTFSSKMPWKDRKRKLPRWKGKTQSQSTDRFCEEFPVTTKPINFN